MKLLDTAKITTIPHHRERIYIVGFQSSEKCKAFQFPESRDNYLKPISNLLEQGLNPYQNSKYYYSDRLKVFPTIRDAVTSHIVNFECFA